jgi:hypothetical protein
MCINWYYSTASECPLYLDDYEYLSQDQAIRLSTLMTESLFTYISDCDTPPKIPWYYFYRLLSWFQIKKSKTKTKLTRRTAKRSRVTRGYIVQDRSTCVVKFGGLPRWPYLEERRYFLFPENNASVKKVRYHKGRPLG